jgi:nucleoid DNA-binding protein
MGKATINSIAEKIEENVDIDINEVIDKEDIKTIINMFLDEVKDNLEEGNKVMLWNFGTFELKEFKERKAKDVNSGEIVIRPKKELPKLKFSNVFLKKFR